MFPIPRRIPLRNGVCLLKILQNSNPTRIFIYTYGVLVFHFRSHSNISLFFKTKFRSVYMIVKWLCLLKLFWVLLSLFIFQFPVRIECNIAILLTCLNIFVSFVIQRRGRAGSSILRLDFPLKMLIQKTLWPVRAISYSQSTFPVEIACDYVIKMGHSTR